MIEKPERLAFRERREPERQPRELHRDGIGIHAGQTSLGNQPAELRALAVVDVGLAEARPPR